VAVLAGCREPVVIILVLISYFTVISGKPLDGVLLLVVAGALAWEAGQRRRRGGRRPARAAGRGPGGPPGSRHRPGTAGADLAAAGPPAAGPAGAGTAGKDTAGKDTAGAGTAGAGTAGKDTTGKDTTGKDTTGKDAAGEDAAGADAAGADAAVLAAAGEAAAGPSAVPASWFTAGQPRATRRSWLLAGAVLAGGALYAVVVGSFTRYSWPATIPVIVLGAAVVGRGWRGPVRSRPEPGPLPLAGAAVWGVVALAGCLWELSALLQQPTFEASSYAHPTISTLTDPLLAGPPGRSLVLAAWLALGWALVRR
jgi:hypothetical protein